MLVGWDWSDSDELTQSAASEEFSHGEALQ
jgi:hypothetical protein